MSQTTSMVDEGRGVVTSWREERKEKVGECRVAINRKLPPQYTFVEQKYTRYCDTSSCSRCNKTFESSLKFRVFIENIFLHQGNFSS